MKKRILYSKNLYLNVILNIVNFVPHLLRFWNFVEIHIHLHAHNITVYWIHMSCAIIFHISDIPQLHKIHSKKKQNTESCWIFITFFANISNQKTLSVQNFRHENLYFFHILDHSRWIEFSSKMKEKKLNVKLCRINDSHP